MKFANIVKGTRAEKAALFSYPGADGALVEHAILLRPLTDAEESDAHAFALQHAKSKGVDKPAPDQPIYDCAFMASALACGCLDPDSPAASRAPFFTSAKEVLDHLTRDQRVYLFELLEAWQDDCSPSLRKMSADQMLAGCETLAKGGGTEADRFLDSLSPAMLRRYARFLGALVWSSLAPKSPSGSPSTADTTSS